MEAGLTLNQDVQNAPPGPFRLGGEIQNVVLPLLVDSNSHDLYIVEVGDQFPQSLQKLTTPEVFGFHLASKFNYSLHWLSARHQKDSLPSGPPALLVIHPECSDDFSQAHD